MALPKRKPNDDAALYAAGDATDTDMVPMPVSMPSDRQGKQPMRIGELLKRERERRGYDLQQIADYLCIRRGLLSAIEGSRYEEFPAEAYVVGFLRSYAELIGLNGQEAINHYRQEMAGRRRSPDLVLPTPVSEGRAPTAVIMVIAGVASLFLYILWYVLSTGDRSAVTPPVLPSTVETTSTQTTDTATAAPTAASETPALQASTETLPASSPSGIAIAAPAPAPTQQSLPPAAPATPPAPAAPIAAQPAPAPARPQASTGTPHLLIKADQASWVLIANSQGQTIYDHVMKAGESYTVPNQPGLTLTTGNGAGIIVELDGNELPRLATTTSHIVRNVSLDTNALKALAQ